MAHSMMENTHSLGMSMFDEQGYWLEDYQDLANFILPRRYVALLSSTSRRTKSRSMRYINDPTGTFAARILAAGMMSGITSPARPWFKIIIEGEDEDDLSTEEKMWLDDVRDELLLIMATSNFYDAMAVSWLDMSVFATSAVLIYEDARDIIRCYVSPCGEYALGADDTNRIDTYTRTIYRSSRQIGMMAERFQGDKDMIPSVIKDDIREGGARLNNRYKLHHMIQPHGDGLFLQLPSFFSHRDLYWFPENASKASPFVLKGFREPPGGFPRWEVMGDDIYGTGPGFDAIPDIMQLQQETKAKGKGLAKQMDPPMLIDASLEHKPTALFPRGKTFVQGLGRITDGMKPAYVPNIPLNDITQDLAIVGSRVQTIFHNDLFRGISNLPTVRSAAEIDVRESEKLVQLGTVVHRSENEGLNLWIRRIYGIAKRRGRFQPPPDTLNKKTIGVRYISILADAQASVGIGAIERYLAFVAQTSSVFPEARNVPNVVALIHEFGERMRLPAGSQHSLEEIQQKNEEDAQQASLQQAAEVGPPLAQAASNLSNTDVGGAAAALQEALG